MSRLQLPNGKMSTVDRMLARPFHTFLFACLPILSLLNANITEMSAVSSIRSFAFSVLLAAVCLLIGRRFLGTWEAGALAATPIIIFFFSYGHLYAALEPVHVLGIQVGRHRHLLPLAAAAVLMVYWIASKYPSFSATLTPIVNVAALAAVAIPAIGLMAYSVGAPGYGRAATSEPQMPIVELQPENAQQLPDIYYIILDAYAREDTLAQALDYDNSEFMSYLESVGFIVADESRANYLWTHLSLASALNLDYMPELLPGYSQVDRGRTTPLIQASRVRRSLEAIGYTTVGFATGWEATELLDAGFVFTPDMSVYARVRNLGLMNEFETLLLENSIAFVFLDLDALANTTVGEFMAARLSDRFSLQREIILSLYDNAASVPELPGPKFVFVHSLAPHGPHIFGANGEAIAHTQAFTLQSDPESSVEVDNQAYLDELTYVSGRIQGVINSILHTSSRPVVIILQSDHGPAVDLDWAAPSTAALQARASILNAYYLPQRCRSMAYRSITPVNSFRVLFNCLFEANLPMLDDQTYMGFYQFTPAEPMLTPVSP